VFGCGPNGLRHVISWIVFLLTAEMIHEITRNKARNNTNCPQGWQAEEGGQEMMECLRVRFRVVSLIRFMRTGQEDPRNHTKQHKNAATERSNQKSQIAVKTQC